MPTTTSNSGTVPAFSEGMEEWKVPLLIALLVTANAGSNAFAQECSQVDLRNFKVAPPRSQLFWDEKGNYTDSGACHAFAVANLIGQIAGQAVSAEDIVLYNRDSPRLQKYEDAVFEKSEAIDGKMRDLNGFPDEDVTRFLGYGACSLTSMDRFAEAQFKTFCGISTFKDQQVEDAWRPCSSHLSCPLSHQDGKANLYEDVMSAVQASGSGDFSVTAFQALYYEALRKKLKPAEMTQLLNRICGRRIQIHGYHAVNLQTKNMSDSAFETEDSDVIMKAIDSALNRGKYVALEYSAHIVTIVGRTEHCEYIIQDSIPYSHYKQLGESELESEHLNNVHFENEHFQYWPQEHLKNSLWAITYLEKDGE